MPRLGPAFLHQPLVLPAGGSLSHALRWLADGALSILPAALSERGWRAANALYEYAPDGALTSLGQIDHSWSGARRRTAATETTNALPAIVTLAPRLVFFTKADLPLAAKTTLAKTIALRMDELSPIPPEEAAFAVGPSAMVGDRLHVDVAIARKKTLEAIEQSQRNRSVAAICAGLTERGEIEFEFTRSNPARAKAAIKLMAAGLMLWLSILLALSAFAARQERMLASFDGRQTALRQELRDLKATEDRIGLLQQFAPASFSLGDVSRTVTSQLNNLPQAVMVDEITVDADNIAISGFWPTNLESESVALSRSASDYPGFDRFSMTALLIASDQVEVASE